MYIYILCVYIYIYISKYTICVYIYYTYIHTCITHMYIVNRSWLPLGPARPLCSVQRCPAEGNQIVGCIACKFAAMSKSSCSLSKSSCCQIQNLPRQVRNSTHNLDQCFERRARRWTVWKNATDQALLESFAKNQMRISLREWTWHAKTRSFLRQCFPAWRLCRYLSWCSLQ